MGRADEGFPVVGFLLGFVVVGLDVGARVVPGLLVVGVRVFGLRVTGFDDVGLRELGLPVGFWGALEKANDQK